MHNSPRQRGCTGKVPYTALCYWKQSVVRNAALWFTVITVDYPFVFWEWKPKKILCEAHDTPKPVVSAGLDGAAQSWTTWTPRLLPVTFKWRCCLLGLKLIYALTEEEVYCGAQRQNSKKQSESKGWFLINQSILCPDLETNVSILLAGRETKAWDTAQELSSLALFRWIPPTETNGNKFYKYHWRSGPLRQGNLKKPSSESLKLFSIRVKL